MRRLVLSTVLLTLGVSFATAAYALPKATAKVPRGGVREGGVFRVAEGFETFQHTDPALAYSPNEWIFLQATCAKLMNYEDNRSPRLVPEVDAGYGISSGGKVYTFTLRPGFKFSNGTTVTAAAFAHEIDRIRALKSDGLQYVQDIAGVAAHGRTLTIRLTHPIPGFMAWLAMPFFCAVPPNLPTGPEEAGAYPSAGPYYFAEYRRGQRLVLRRNSYYRGKRPHHVASIVVDLVSSAEVMERFKRGTADWADPRGAVFYPQARELVRKYGQSGRLSFRPRADVRYFALNTERPLFRNNARLRRAVNFALDRRALAAAHGYRVARPTDQYLPIGFPGFKEARIYPSRPNLKRAKALARGRLRGRKAVMYVPALPIGTVFGQIVKANLAKIGLEVEVKTLPFGGAYIQKVLTPGEPFDIAWWGWGADYNDPAAFIDALFDGRHIGQPSSVNASHFNSPKYNRLIDRASRLVGAARYRAYARLDRQLAREAAPMVAFAVANSATMVSARVDPRCKILNPDLDLAAVCLKR